MIDAKALLVAMLDAIESDPELAARLRRVLCDGAPADDGAELLDRGQAAARIGIERKALDMMIRAGELRTRKIGRRVLVTVADVRAAVEARATTREPERSSGPQLTKATDPALAAALKRGRR